MATDYGSFEWPPQGSGSGSGVTSLNSETGDINLTSVDSSVTITPSGQTIDLSVAVPTRGNLTDVGTDGIVVTGGTNAVFGSGTSIAQHVADTTHNGYLSSTDWNTFNGKQPTITTGNLTDAGTDGITVTGGTGAVIGSGTSIAQHVADSTHNGYLSSTDWSTFNGKQAALIIGNLTDAGTDGIVVTGGTGSVIGSGTSIAQHVADSTHNGYLSSTDWTTFNNKGSGTVTAVSVASANGFAGSSSGGSTPALTLSTTITGILSGNGTAISAASTTGSGAVVLATSPTIVTPTIVKIANLTTNGIQYVSGGDGTLNSGPLTGDITSSALATTLATVNSNVGSFTYASITVNGKGLITAASSGSTPPAYAATTSTTTILTSVGGAVTKGTMVIDDFSYGRYGDRMMALVKFQQSTTSSGGSGIYLFTLPASLAFASSVKVSSTVGSASIVGTGLGSRVTDGISDFSSLIQIYAYDTTHVALVYFGTTTSFLTVSSANTSIAPGSQSNVNYSFNINAPISGW